MNGVYMKKLSKESVIVAICTAIVSIITAFNGYEIEKSFGAMVQMQEEMLYIEKGLSVVDQRVDYLYSRLINRGN